MQNTPLFGFREPEHALKENKWTHRAFPIVDFTEFAGSVPKFEGQPKADTFTKSPESATQSEVQFGESWSEAHRASYNRRQDRRAAWGKKLRGY